MSDDLASNHLSRISTLWTIVRQAHGVDAEVQSVAHARIVDRYSGAVYRYLVAVLRDGDAADEVFQEFALKLARGGFRNADESRGRFRDYVKVSILRLVNDFYRRRERQDKLRVAGPSDELDIKDRSAEPDLTQEESFLASCRDELLGRAWLNLKSEEAESGKRFFTVLDFRSRNPDFSSQQMADALNKELQPERPFTASGIRKLLERARVRFSDLLLDEVMQTMEEPDSISLEEELIDLGLHPYCGNAWQRRFGNDGVS